MRYALYFALSVVCLTTGTVLTFNHLSGSDALVARADTLARPTADTVPTREVDTPVEPSAADYARFAAADSAWRSTHARQYTVADLRLRVSDGRTERDGVQDRVFELVKAGQTDRAIFELEGWVRAHPTDSGLLLSLARLLSETGRSDDAVRRYRQILALERGTK